MWWFFPLVCTEYTGFVFFFSFVRFRGFVASLGLMRVLLGSGLVGLGFRVLGLG